MMKKNKSLIAIILLFTLVLACFPANQVNAAKGKVSKITISNLKDANPYVMKKGAKKKLRVKVTTTGKKVSKKVGFKSSNKKAVKVSSKGVITAKKAKGKATITVYAKANKKINKKIKVVVGQPVQAVAFAKKTMSLTVGAKQQVAASVSPKAATVKKVSYKSSNSAVVTVNSQGQVVAKKAGRAVITAKATDGSSKSGTCTVTVANAAPKGITIASAKVINANVIQFTLSKPQALKQSDIRIFAKQNELASFVNEEKIALMKNDKNQTYSVSVFDEIGLRNGAQVKLQVSNLKGTGTFSKVIKSSIGSIYKRVSWQIQAKANEVFNKEIELTQTMVGSAEIISKSNLPAGITVCIPKHTSGQTMTVSGVPTKCGTYKSTIRYYDQGDSERRTENVMEIVFLIYDDNHVAIGSMDEESYCSSLQVLKNPIFVAGGTAPYKVTIENGGNAFVVDESGAYYSVINASNGTHNLKLKVTDAKNRTASYVVQDIVRGGGRASKIKFLNSKGEEVSPKIRLLPVSGMISIFAYGTNFQDLRYYQGPDGTIGYRSGTYVLQAEYNEKRYTYPANIVVSSRKVNNIVMQFPEE